MLYLSHHTAYVVLDPLRIGVFGRWKTNRMSSSGCCVLTKRCFARSMASKSPLVSTSIPLGSSKSTVYVRSVDGTTYLILTTSKRTLTPLRFRVSALVASSPDLNPCLKPAAKRLPFENHEGRALITIEESFVKDGPQSGQQACGDREEEHEAK